jgi:peptidoglycan hydrolase-like protein with peptidoglycan-binding domain
MFARMILSVFLALALAGCATARKGNELQAQQLQGRISHLETELERKNQEILSLEDELARTQEISSKQKISDKDISGGRLSIRQIQTALKNAGFYKGPVDGRIGPRTKEAIKEFQKANGLKADGVVGKKTSAELNKYLYR